MLYSSGKALVHMATEGLLPDGDELTKYTEYDFEFAIVYALRNDNPMAATDLIKARNYGAKTIYSTIIKRTINYTEFLWNAVFCHYPPLIEQLLNTDDYKNLISQKMFLYLLEDAVEADNTALIKQIVAKLNLHELFSSSSGDLNRYITLVKNGARKGQEVLAVLLPTPEIKKMLVTHDEALNLAYRNGYEKTGHLLLTSDAMLMRCISILEYHRYFMELHPEIFIKLFSMFNEENTPYFLIATLVERLCCDKTVMASLYVDEADPPQRFAKINGLISTSLFDNLAAGPLNKSEQTKEIERILKRLSQKSVFVKTQITYRDQQYFIKLPSENEINLSILLKNANLSHLSISTQVIDRIGAILKPLVKEWDDTESKNPITNLLHPVERSFAYLYFGYAYYNVNAFFRSEPLGENRLLEDSKIKFIHHANFIMGCLLNDAINKLPALVQEHSSGPLSAEIKALSHDSTFLDRKETLPREVLARRTANPTSNVNALTSFSVFKNGSEWINFNKNIHTKLENGRGFNINRLEGEIVYPHGVQVLTKKISKDLFIARQVCSPTLERNRYWSDLALKHAWDNYLCKPHTEAVENIVNYRHKNGLPHTFRMMLLTEHIANYFAHYAKDNEFKAFCQSLTENDQEALRIAAAFSLSGWESGVSADVYSKKYARYRKTSADNLRQFVYSALPIAAHSMTETMTDVVHHLGLPDYETNLNQHPDELERKRRNYFHRILSMVHHIQLASSSNASEFSLCMLNYQALSMPSPSQNNAFNELLRYHFQLMKAHGDELSCDVQPDGTFVDADIYYKNIFQEVGSSLKRVYEVSETVPRPIITLAFQFENQAESLSKRKAVTLINHSSKRQKLRRSPELDDVIQKRRSTNRYVSSSKRIKT